MKIAALSGSLRAGSSNLALLRAAARAAPKGMTFVFYDELGALPHFNPDLDGEGAEPPPAVARLRALVAAADGVVISCPEYAHGVPGSFKNALDWLVSSVALSDKPVLLLNASAAGGDRAQASLVETLTVMGANVLAVSPPVLKRKLDADGRGLDDEAARALRATLDALAAAVN